MRYGKVHGGVVAAAVVALMGASPGLAQDQPAPHTFEQAQFAEQPVTPERLTAAFHMTKYEQTPTRAFASPASMLADPSNPRVIVAATADLRTRVCHLVRSTDAGSTWHLSESLPAPSDYPYCTNNNAGVAEASIAWGRNGTLYYALQAYGDGEGFREGRASIALARSTDLGNTWSTTLVEDNRGSTEVHPPSAEGVTGVAVDTSGPRDVVYVGFTRRYRTAPDDSPLNNPHVFVATSTDGGATFPPAVNLNDFPDLTQRIAGKSYPLLMRSSFGAPFLTAHDGVVLAVTGSQTPFDNEPPPPPEAGAGLEPGSYYAHPLPQLVARSTDQGRTWSVTKLGPPIYAGTGNQTGLGWTPKGGPEGTFVAAYAA
ncbi:MAG: glycoside hydrolase, partial [Actinomycetota bacterium]|nr:glycoside hydrolase [Actinomycetota bacterium]